MRAKSAVFLILIVLFVMSAQLPAALAEAPAAVFTVYDSDATNTSDAALELRSVAWHPNGSYALIVGDNKTVIRYNDTNFTNIDPPSITNGTDFYSVEWHPNLSKNYALIVGKNFTSKAAPNDYIVCMIYNGTTNNFTDVATPSDDIMPMGISWDPNGSYALIAAGNITPSSGRVYRYWDNGTFENLIDSDAILYDVAWQPQGEYALIAGSGGKVMNYSNASGGTFDNITSPSVNDSYAVGWKSDGSEALLVGLYHTVLKYENATGSLSSITSSVPANDFTYPQTLGGIDWKPNGSYAVIAGSSWNGSGENSTIYTYNGTNFTEYYNDTGTTEELGVLDFHPTEDYAVITGKASTVVIFEEAFISIITPANGTDVDDYTPLLQVIFSEAVNYSWYKVDGGANSTLYSDTSNLTVNLSFLDNGQHNVTVYANKSTGALYTSVSVFNVNYTSQTINLDDPSLESIQAAINAANPGDTINVLENEWKENVDVNKSVNLIGASIVVNGTNASDHVINVSADSVNISGFTVTGTNVTSGKAGIYVENADFVKIENVYSANNSKGIALSGCNNATIANNTVYVGVEDTNTTHNVYGLWMYYSDSSNITNNSVTIKDYFGGGINQTKYYGFYLESSDKNALSDDEVSIATYGFYFLDSHYNELSNSTVDKDTGAFPDGLYGIVVNQSSYNVLVNNTAFMYSFVCDASDHFGIYLKNASNNIISESTIYDWEYGIYVYHYSPTYISSRNNSILGNDIYDNCDGIEIFDSYSSQEFNGSSLIANNSIYSNSWTGIDLSGYKNNTITGNTIESNQRGIYLSGAHRNIISSNIINGSSSVGISLTTNSSNLTIYDNFFNNSKNVDINLFGGAVYTNDWNTTKTAGTNVVRGPYIGGNYWAYPNGTGFSKNCSDTDGDGICDSDYNLTSGNVDYLPLSLATINVCPTCGYTTIQAAVNAAKTGSTINVSAGNYNENVDVDKSVTLVGAGADLTVVNASNSSDHVFYVTANSVNISGFTVTGATGTGKGGIYGDGSNYSNFSCNNATNNKFGIALRGSLNVTISNNSANSNDRGIYIETSSGCVVTENTANSNTVVGLDIFVSSNNSVVLNNIIEDNNYGIEIHSSSYNTLSNNNMTNNKYGNFYIFGAVDLNFNNSVDTSNLVDGEPVYYVKYGANSSYEGIADLGVFYCIWCNNVTVKDLNITGKGHAIRFWGTNNSRIKDVNADSNTYGISLEYSNNNTIVSNNISNSSEQGIYLGQSTDNVVENNTLDKNYDGSGGGDSAYCKTIYDNAIFLFKSNRSNIINNNITDQGLPNSVVSGHGIFSSCSNNSVITRNSIINTSRTGIAMHNSFGGTIYSNNLINSTQHAYDNGGNTWDGGYSSGGNYWDNWTSPDADGDGIVDYLYDIPGGSSEDRYPVVTQNGWLNINPQSIEPPVTAKFEGNVTENQTMAVNFTDEVEVYIEFLPIKNSSVNITVGKAANNASVNTTNMTSAYGVSQNQKSLDRYVKINVTGDKINSTDNIYWVHIRFYYSDSDLDKNGDGDASDAGDINENALKLYWYWENGSQWMPVNTGNSLAAKGGPVVNGTDTDKNENYIWANLSHFSVYGVAGDIVVEDSGTPGGGGGGGGGGGADEPTITVTAEEGKVEITIDFLPANEGTAVTIPETGNMPLSELNINVNKKVSEVEMNITTLDEKPENISANVSGKVSDYIQIDTNVDDADINNVTNAFKVPLSWINDNRIDKEQIVLNRYADDTWNALTTTQSSEDSEYVHYSAVSPGFSVFSISGEKKSIELPKMAVVTTTIPPWTTPPPTAPVTTAPPEAPKKGNKGIYASILLLIAIVLLARYILKEEEEE